MFLFNGFECNSNFCIRKLMNAFFWRHYSTYLYCLSHLYTQRKQRMTFPCLCFCSLLQMKNSLILCAQNKRGQKVTNHVCRRYYSISLVNWKIKLTDALTKSKQCAYFFLQKIPSPNSNLASYSFTQKIHFDLPQVSNLIRGTNM